MSYEIYIRDYKQRERKCPVCGAGLPAHRTWPGVRHRLCGRPDCDEQFKAANPRAKYIHANERKCEAGNCRNFLPEGWYWFRPKRLSCSPECWLRRHKAVRPSVPCSCGCGELVQRFASNMSVDGLNFIDRAHLGEYQASQTIRLCGPFIGIVQVYLNGFAKSHYREPKKHKPRLLPFFQFLTERGVADLEDVTPQTVTAYFEWGRTTGRQVVAYSAGTLSTFFGWLMREGRRKGANPVIPLIHKAPFKRRL